MLSAFRLSTALAAPILASLLLSACIKREPRAEGESDNSDPEWADKVAEIVSDLWADLQLSEDVPFIAGDLPFDGCCAQHNDLVRKLPGAIPSAYVVSSRDLTVMDKYHFDLESQREMGRRYGELMLDLIPAP